MYNVCDYFLCNFWVKLGYFLVQHLVTLFTNFKECRCLDSGKIGRVVASEIRIPYFESGH